MSTPRLRTAVRIDHDSWHAAIPGLSRMCRKAVRSAWAVGRKALDKAHPFAGPLAAPVEVSVLFTSDEAIRDLNRSHRNKDTATNVLSFPCDDTSFGTGTEILLGDVVLAWETVESEATEAKKPVEDHMAHLVVHGVLHLLGYDHESDTDAATMERLEVDSVARLGLPIRMKRTISIQ